MGLHVQVVEDPPIPVKENSEATQIRVFTLSLNGVIVELSSVGASITKLLLPKADGTGHDDIVLGYDSAKEMFESGNPPYFGVIVGRVANRIANGKFTLDGVEYTLETNNGPNHLHGGKKGFSKCLWDAEILEDNGISKGVQFSLLSPHGDQGYPGTILATATYRLVENQNQPGSATLRLEMTAELKDDKPSPISLAQHSYFNLAKHNSADGILDHKVTLNCGSYTPTDTNSIPTREVVDVRDDLPMDLMGGRKMRDALQMFAVEKGKVDDVVARRHVSQLSRCEPDIAKTGANAPSPQEPYGFDHNYVVTERTDGADLSLVGTVEHEASNRRMKVFTSAPGVQVYTANFLDGLTPSPKISKENAAYGQWQGICLEAQYFPDSILGEAETEKYPDFAKGKCYILRPGKSPYQNIVEFAFESIS